jgi:hypothetical protein
MERVRAPSKVAFAMWDRLPACLSGPQDAPPRIRSLPPWYWENLSTKRGEINWKGSVEAEKRQKHRIVARCEVPRAKEDGLSWKGSFCGPGDRRDAYPTLPNAPKVK